MCVKGSGVRRETQEDEERGGGGGVSRGTRCLFVVVGNVNLETVEPPLPTLFKRTRVGSRCCQNNQIHLSPNKHKKRSNTRNEISQKTKQEQEATKEKARITQNRKIKTRL